MSFFSPETATAVQAAAPDSLTVIELVEFTRFVAGEVCAGRYPFVDFDDRNRWHQRIYRDQRVDVWLISWLPDQGTQLHDHGGSAGSLTVISGELVEAVYSETASGALRERRHEAGRSIGFDRRYVHDVRNLSDAPAVSVHAYSPPLTSMTYYDVRSGDLVEVATLLTDDPEPAVTPG